MEANLKFYIIIRLHFNGKQYYGKVRDNRSAQLSLQGGLRACVCILFGNSFDHIEYRIHFYFFQYRGNTYILFKFCLYYVHSNPTVIKNILSRETLIRGISTPFCVQKYIYKYIIVRGPPPHNIWIVVFINFKTQNDVSLLLLRFT